MTSLDLSALLEILACPICQACSNLSIQAASMDNATQWTATLKEAQPVSREIVCHECHHSYPITWDDIPVLWSDTLRDTFTNLDTTKVAPSNPNEQDVKAANIHVYEKIVDEYDKAGIHADTITQGRFVHALSTSNCHLLGWHLDVGCGSGNALEATNPTSLNPKVGLDITLSGLRAVRNKGFYAVLGDAEALPFRPASIALITASSVLHHLFDPTSLISESYRVLKPGGGFLSDFDPSKKAAEWSWLMKHLYELRLPFYRFLSRCIPHKVGHSSQTVQTWNKIAEFHNYPGAGFSPSQLSNYLETAGFEVLLVFPHNNTKDNNVTWSRFVTPSLRHFIVQVLSGRNPFARKNADTLLTLSYKPAVKVANK